MKVIAGHLTEREKKSISAILELKAWSGKVGKKRYFITKKLEIYQVVIQQKDRGLIPCASSELRISIYTSTFTL